MEYDPCNADRLGEKSGLLAVFLPFYPDKQNLNRSVIHENRH